MSEPAGYLPEGLGDLADPMGLPRRVPHPLGSGLGPPATA